MQVVDYGKIKKIMDDKRLRLDDFVPVLGLTKASISRKLRGKIETTITEFLKIASVLETDVRELFVDEEAIKQYMLVAKNMRLTILSDLPQFVPADDPLSPFVKELFTKTEIEEYKRNYSAINWDSLQLVEYTGDDNE